MIIYKNLVILGTSHISAQSIKEVRQYLTINNPDLVALELDVNRFTALTNKEAKGSSLELLIQLGLIPFILSKIGQKIQKELGKMVGVDPGSEMLEAVKIAQEKKISIVLIDQDIRVTLKKLAKKITLREKFRFLLDLITSPFSKEAKIKIDLTKVPERDLIDHIIKKIKKRYPSFYKVLIEDRNKILAKNLYNLNLTPKREIFVIVGAGHISGLLEELKKMGY